MLTNKAPEKFPIVKSYLKYNKVNIRLCDIMIINLEKYKNPLQTIVQLHVKLFKRIFYIKNSIQ